jgi:DNA-binding LacI/PurR family transcriptional regulator
MTDGRSLYLHGNRIASRLLGGDIFLISDAGWRTSTTRERLNGLIDCLAEQGYKVRPRISFAQNSNDLTSGDWERANQV